MPQLNVDRQGLSSIWSIKNPTLRNVRLKVLYKDIFSNERRFRFGLAESPKCTICGAPETVEHQILTCPNAQTFWNHYNLLTSQRVQSLEDIIPASQTTATEIVKSIILKMLIQIDRSSGLPMNVVKQECLYYLRLEIIVNWKKQSELQGLIDVINNL